MPDATRGHTVLLVHAPGDTRDAYEAALRAQGCVLLTSDTTSDALARVARELPRLVVTSLLGKEIDADDLISFLRRQALDVPVAVLTNFPHPRTLEFIVEIGAALALVTPVAPDVLAGKIAELLGRNAIARAS